MRFFIAPSLCVPGNRTYLHLLQRFLILRKVDLWAQATAPWCAGTCLGIDDWEQFNIATLHDRCVFIVLAALSGPSRSDQHKSSDRNALLNVWL